MSVCLSVCLSVCSNPLFATEGGYKENLRCAELQTSFYYFYFKLEYASASWDPHYKKTFQPWRELKGKLLVFAFRTSIRQQV